ncbi:unnamed protein product (macronuclear) [Paramecium tetraurelia]|uniref:EF-hand domain-containing protein n=1 Tax=Paramecium tetraurelia TaxID=5888 RepID=A0D7G2_PARTE|nr:uncharacterized protein GSPATT00002021001 [Paramecium tetraurelia]CAK78979.1 unnamed protein product [Paramecium tetraurelia]|eukprot:XP_001446376.1 hypothetical protein (macronuclear) [Paramecium tetraurelia strain d4-2]
MIQIPYAKHHQSQIQFAESQITNLDKNIIKVLQLFSVIGQLEMDIENIRLELSENSHFYPEALFQYLKLYLQPIKPEPIPEKPQFFNFTDLQIQAPLVINVINSAKDGIIKFENIIAFMQDNTSVPPSAESLRTIERVFHINQFAFQKDNVLDTFNNEYPLPQDVIPLSQIPIIQIQGTSKVPLQQKENIEKVNSGDGFNYATFQKMLLSKSIPQASQKAQKRKLIYETNQRQQVDSSILKLFINLLQNEIALIEKSEQIRLVLNTDSSYNHVTMFNIFDSQGNGEIEYRYIEQLMNKAQIPFKPFHFKSLIRRANILAKNASASETLNFEGYRLIATVQCPYFKIPKHEEEQLQLQHQYSRILGAEVNGQNSSQLSISRIPEKIRNNSQNYRSTPLLSTYNSGSPYVNETLKKQSKISTNNYHQDEAIYQDNIVYGTKKEWDELQHSLCQNNLIDSRSLKSQILRIQNPELSVNNQRIGSRNNTPRENKNQIELIQQQALVENVEKMRQNDMSKQLQYAMGANTKGLYSNFVKIERDNKMKEDLHSFYNQAPWYQTDNKISKNIDIIKLQQSQIQKVSGVQNKVHHESQQQNVNNQNAEIRNQIANNNQQSAIDSQQQQSRIQQNQSNIQQINKLSPVSPRIFSTQKLNPLIGNDNQQIIMDYNYDIPKRVFDHQN